jgi:acyl transferase domain-containing protein
MLAADGRCKVLDGAADGYVRGEAVTSIVLRAWNTLDARLARASALGDTAQLVILGTAVNQDGRSSSLTAPNGRAQQELIITALKQARAPASQVPPHAVLYVGAALGPHAGSAPTTALLLGRHTRGRWAGPDGGCFRSPSRSLC